MKGVYKTADDDWREKMRRLLGAISRVQARRHTVSLRELEMACGVSRQTIANWLLRAEQLGYVDRHSPEPRAVQLLPLGERTLQQLTLRVVKDARKRARKARYERAGMAANL
jgi:Mn-dependent DtxR family transcriptional regulator